MYKEAKLLSKKLRAEWKQAKREARREALLVSKYRADELKVANAKAQAIRLVEKALYDATYDGICASVTSLINRISSSTFYTTLAEIDSDLTTVTAKIASLITMESEAGFSNTPMSALYRALIEDQVPRTKSILEILISRGKR